jgi:hypothetical protein
MERNRLEIDISGLRFGEVGVFERIVSTCFGVEKLQVLCSTINIYTALAALLRDPRTVMQCLNIWNYDIHIHHIDIRLALRKIAASLVGNTKLMELGLLQFFTQEVYDEFDTILCNASSLESICKSNHTLAKIFLMHGDLSACTEECLDLNKDENKNRVIRNKILQYYFIGGFSLAPFSVMPASVLAEVLSLGAKSNKQTAIFELLRGIPDLCNVSSRSISKLEPDNGLDTNGE